jgi:tetratricopeptide (TPR) repeat protein
VPSFETLFAVLLGVLVAATAAVLFLALRRTGTSPAVTALSAGRFAAALDAARTGPDAGRDELFAAAVAAKHLLRFADARALLTRILSSAPDDGEALLESALVAAYAGDGDADRTFQQAAALRSDLGESITLHRAWAALRRGDRERARRMFEEIEAPLETKLRSDLGAGEPLFAEWFLHSAALWSACGDTGRAAWAARQGRASAPESRLPEIVLADFPVVPLE